MKDSTRKLWKTVKYSAIISSIGTLSYIIIDSERQKSITEDYSRENIELLTEKVEPTYLDVNNDSLLDKIITSRNLKNGKTLDDSNAIESKIDTLYCVKIGNETGYVNLEHYKEFKN